MKDANDVEITKTNSGITSGRRRKEEETKKKTGGERIGKKRV